MQLKSRQHKPKKRYAKTCTEIYFDGQWLSFGLLAKHPKLEHLGLNSAILFHRWHGKKDSHGVLKQDRTPERLFRPKRHKNAHFHKRSDDWLYEGCTTEQIKALEEGTNRALLAV